MPLDLSDFSGYLLVVVLITVTPGPDTVLVVNRAVRYGRGKGVVTALGSASGLVVWGSLAAVGIAALLAMSATAFALLKIGGAVYLLYLGLRAIFAPSIEFAQHSSGSRTMASAFRQGLTTNLLNPKAGAFFTALLPQFLPAIHTTATLILFYALVASLASFIGLTAYAHLAAAARDRLRRPYFRRLMDRISGAVLVGIGIRLALEVRPIR